MEAVRMAKEDFRDHVGNQSASGKRLWIYPKKPSGRYHKWRSIVSWGLMALLFTGPFIRVQGRPLMLFNIMERKFILFGFPFWPQDFMLFALAMLLGLVLIVLFTVVYGRVFCGWVCPQTIFMEMLFRKVEYWIEGDWKQQQKLEKEPWNRSKIIKKLIKHSIFVLLAFWISNTFLAYIIGIDDLKLMVKNGPMAHLGTFVALVGFAGAFYYVFAFFRELVCIYVCPYGRLQGVMLDKSSIVVAYDFLRGEPRGKIKKGQDQSKLGDCIDCGLCVSVCPTGIDIRNGTQLECINCTACIDACDDVMTSIKREKGLIRYDSQEAIAEGKKWRVSPRVILYTAVLVILTGIFAYFLVTRKSVEATLIRTPGALYQEQDSNRVSNLYNIEFINKSFETKEIELRLVQPSEGTIKIAGKEKMEVKEGELYTGTFMVIVPQESIRTNNTDMEIEVWVNGEAFQTLEANFIGPVKKKKQ